MAGANIWYGWVDSSSCTASTNTVWNNWTTGSSITTDDSVWYAWNTTATASNTITVTPYAVREPTAEEQAEYARQNEARRRQQEENARLAAEAKARAEALLDEHLTDEQRAELQRERYLTVESKTSKRRYRIHAGRGRHGNIKEVDEAGQEVASLCCAPVGDIPEADALLAQKLYLEHAEDEFLGTAAVRGWVRGLGVVALVREPPRHSADVPR